MSGKPLLGSLFHILHSLPRRSSSPEDAAPPQHVVHAHALADKLRSSCYDVACAIAGLDARCAHLILSALVAQHQPSLVDVEDAETMGEVESQPETQIGQLTLARLSSGRAHLLAHQHGPLLTAYYGFLSTLLYSCLNAHSHESTVVHHAVRLAVLLAAETPALPEAHLKHSKLLFQARWLVVTCCLLLPAT